jgi:hypothetical protein
LVAVQLGKRVELMARFDALANSAAGRRYQHAARDRDRAIAAGLDVILRGLQKSDARFGPHVASCRERPSGASSTRLTVLRTMLGCQ